VDGFFVKFLEIANLVRERNSRLYLGDVQKNWSFCIPRLAFLL